MLTPRKVCLGSSWIAVKVCCNQPIMDKYITIILFAAYPKQKQICSPAIIWTMNSRGQSYWCWRANQTGLTEQLPISTSPWFELGRGKQHLKLISLGSLRSSYDCLTRHNLKIAWNGHTLWKLFLEWKTVCLKDHMSSICPYCPLIYMDHSQCHLNNPEAWLDGIFAMDAIRGYTCNYNVDGGSYFISHCYGICWHESKSSISFSSELNFHTWTPVRVCVCLFVHPNIK